MRARFFGAGFGAAGLKSFFSSASTPFLKHLGQHHGKPLWVSEAAGPRSSPRHAAVSW